MRRFLLIVFSFLISVAVYAQTGTVTGRILDEVSKEPLPGANAVLKGTALGSITDLDGYFSFGGVPTGDQVIVISYVGYENIEKMINITSGTTDLGTINLKLGAIGLKEVEVIASFAIDRRTPVAVSTINGKYISEKVGSQEFPEILRNTPSVYVTKQGGGFGDSRINLRGFDQRNTAVMINGVPVNDMENGWVYWSNWAGLSDVTSQLQIQRGLSASKLAISSVGGTINIVTNAAEMEKGGNFNVSVGNDGYQKYGLVLSTGLGKSGWAFTIQGTYTRGNGYVDGTKFRAGSYFMSLAKKINNRHILTFTALGAPQWHHQRTISNYDPVNLEDIKNMPSGIKYNWLWGNLNGEEYTWRRNFYHKPKIFMNWYWNITDKTELATTAYVSMGRGGGTGPRGRLNGMFETDDTFLDSNGQFRFQDVQSWNSGGSVPDFGDDRTDWENTDPGALRFDPTDYDNQDGFFADKYVNTSRYGFIRRASMNSHNWYGILSTLTTSLSENWNLVAGIDLRYYRGIHYRRVNDLLGSDAYFTRTDVNISGEFISQEKPANALVNIKNDKKLNYHNDGLVGWYGAFGQIEYVNDAWSAHLTTSASIQSYQRVDYFNYYYSDALSEAAGFEEKMYSEVVIQPGGNVKGGVNYNISSKHNVFFNGGYYSKQPLFDAVFLNFVNEVNQDLKNEKITGLELGYGFRSRFLKANVNLYRTTWEDRFLQAEVRVPSGEEGTANLYGIAQNHSGIEVELSGEIAKSLELDVMVSVGNWVYANDVVADVFDDNQDPIGEHTLYIDGVKVGDAAQTTGRIGLTWTIIRDLRLYGNYFYAANLYSDFSPDDGYFEDPDNEGALKIPDYGLVDLGLYYSFKVGKSEWSWRLNINNLLNEEYISEIDYIKDRDNIEANIGYWGFGRTWNTGITINF